MDNKGIALLEFAIIALLLLTLAIGIIDWGLITQDSQALSNAVREGAREASLGGTPDSITSVVMTNAPTPKQGETPTTVTVRYREFIDPSGWTDWGPDYIAGSGKVQVKVRGEFRCNRISEIMGTSPIVLSSELTVQKE